MLRGRRLSSVGLVRARYFDPRADLHLVDDDSRLRRKDQARHCFQTGHSRRRFHTGLSLNLLQAAMFLRVKRQDCGSTAALSSMRH